MTPNSPSPAACADLLTSLVRALTEAAPRLNQGLPFPQRTGIASAAAGDVRRDASGRCSLALTVRLLGGVEKRYALTLAPEPPGPTLTVSDEADFEERFRLASPPGGPPDAADVRRLFEALTTDLAGHFAAES